jgi:hypothetical protein
MDSTEFFDFLTKWKELVGAAIGGVFALAVALIVAKDARSREDRSAAVLLIVAFTNLAARSNSLSELATADSVPEADRHSWLADKLSKSSPRLTSLAEAALARLLPVHPILAVHLELFRTHHAELEAIVSRVAQDYRDLHQHGRALRPDAVMDADARNCRSAFEGAVRHGDCASRLIQLFVLSKVPTWNMLRYRMAPTQEMRNCRAPK